MICTLGTLLGVFKVNEAAVAITKAVIMFDGVLAVRKNAKAFQDEFGGELISPST
jgi:hypothetical protein